MAVEYSAETEPICCSESNALIFRVPSLSPMLTGNHADSGAEEVLMVDGSSTCDRLITCNLCASPEKNLEKHSVVWVPDTYQTKTRIVLNV